MKILITLMCFVSVSIGLHGQEKKLKISVENPIQCTRNPYQLVFHDEFDGDSLDTKKWYTYYPYGNNSTQDSCSFCRTHVTANIFREKNVVVKNGMLQLISDKESGVWFDRKFDYTSGMVYSKQVFNTFGKYEIRCKLPAGKQQWPAFWIFGWNTEIDIFEFICDGPNKPEFSIHNWLTEYCPKKKFDKSNPCYSSQTGKINFGIDFSQEFHTFTMEYEPHMIKFYIDNVMFRYVPKYYDLRGNPINHCDLKPGEYKTEPAFPLPGEPVQVIANQSVCHKHKQKNPIFPNVMEIDYIRVYQRNEQADLLDLDMPIIK